MKSTKYQLLKADYDFMCKQLKEYRLIIDDLRKENEELKRHIKWSKDEGKQELLDFLDS